jgi:hypothetical protein
MQFEKAIQALCDGGVEFVVIGGVSTTFHGSARVTYDLDICYSRAPENLSRITNALAPFQPRPRGFPAELPFIWDEKMLGNATVPTLQTDVGAIDLLGEVTGLGAFEDVEKHSVSVDAFERRFGTLDLPSLIQAKRAAGRDKDISALAELESLLEADAKAGGP